MPDARTDTPKCIAEAMRESLAGFFQRHHEVETATRWVCSECQFESNQFYEDHAPGCSKRVLVVPLGVEAGT